MERCDRYLVIEAAIKHLGVIISMQGEDFKHWCRRDAHQPLGSFELAQLSQLDDPTGAPTRVASHVCLLLDSDGRKCARQGWADRIRIFFFFFSFLHLNN